MKTSLSVINATADQKTKQDQLRFSSLLKTRTFNFIYIYNYLKCCTWDSVYDVGQKCKVTVRYEEKVLKWD